MAELTYDELRRLQRKEMASAALVQLPNEFYADAAALLERNDSALRGNFTLQLAREYENTLKIIRDIYSKREGKILLRAMRAARTGDEVEGLAAEEKALLSSVVTLLEKNRERFEHRLSPKKAPQPAQQGEKTRLTLLMDLPEFVGLDGSVYGPFQCGAETLMAPEEAQRLVRRGAAREL